MTIFGFSWRRSKATDPVFVDLTNDWAFKAVLGNEANEEVLLELLRQLIPNRKISEIEYIDKEKKALRRSGKSSTFDVYCKTSEGERIIIEMQNNAQKHFLSRSIFYSTFAVQDQMKRGLKEYGFAPVYMISFMCEDIAEFKGRTDYITRLNLCTQGDRIFVADNLNFIYVELNKFLKTEEELSDDDVLSGLLYSIKHMSRLKEIPHNLQTPLFRRLYAASRFAAMNALEQYRYIRAMTTKEDIKAQISWGIEQGIEQGMKKGREEGREERNIEIAREMKANGIPDEMICKCTSLSMDVVEGL